jgi:hypothetical protein
VVDFAYLVREAGAAERAEDALVVRGVRDPQIDEIERVPPM